MYRYFVSLQKTQIQQSLRIGKLLFSITSSAILFFSVNINDFQKKKTTLNLHGCLPNDTKISYKYTILYNFSCDLIKKC